MHTIYEIKNAVQMLSRDDLTNFRDWFLGFDAVAWDKRFEEDVIAGRLDNLADEDIRDLRERRCTARVARVGRESNANPDPRGLSSNYSFSDN